MLITDNHAICFQAVLRRRDAIQMEYESTIDELNKKKDEREHVSRSSLFFMINAIFWNFLFNFISAALTMLNITSFKDGFFSGWSEFNLPVIYYVPEGLSFIYWTLRHPSLITYYKNVVISWHCIIAGENLGPDLLHRSLPR